MRSIEVAALDVRAGEVRGLVACLAVGAIKAVPVMRIEMTPLLTTRAICWTAF